MAKRVRVHEFGPSSVMKVESFDPDEDLVCGDDQIVVQIKSIGVNPVETYIRSGQYASLPQLPYTPGKVEQDSLVELARRLNRSAQVNESGSLEAYPELMPSIVFANRTTCIRLPMSYHLNKARVSVFHTERHIVH